MSSCDPAKDSASTAVSAPRVGSAAPLASKLAPLQAEAPLVELQTKTAWVSVPVGARGARPIVLFWDGHSRDTKALCPRLFALAERVPFVLCVRALDGPANPRASHELRGALEDLKQRFGAHVASGSIVFIASGSVVSAGLQAVREEPSFFSRVAFVSDERIPWSATLASLFGKGGGLRVLMACRSDKCAAHTAHPIHWLTRQGAKGRSAETKSAELPFGEADWHWLVEGDERYDRP